MARVAGQEARLNYLSGLIHDQIEPKIVEEYTTLKAWGLDKPMMSIEQHKKEIYEMNTQLYRAYKRIKELMEQVERLKSGG